MPDCWQPEGHEDWRETEGLGTPHQTRWRHTVFAVKEPATPWHAKAFGADVDDVLLLTALMWLAVKRLPARLLADGRIQADAWLQVQGRKTQRRMVSAAIGTVFVQDSADAARAQWRSVADQLRDSSPSSAPSWTTGRTTSWPS